MKKIVAFLLLTCMMLGLAACGDSGASYTLGLGVSLNTDSSSDNNAQVDATVAAVVLDADGKIVACRLDCAQSKMDVTGGAVDAAKTFQTKMELGDNYGMVAYGNAIAEWYDQAKAFESYVVGKTAAEVQAIETTTNDHGYIVAADETLYASCTMGISDFIDAVVKACGDEKGSSFTGKDFTLGVAAVTEAGDSTPAADGNDAQVKMYSHFGAAVVDKDGKILAALTDATQPVITANAEGQITGSTFKGTKRELGADYGMVAYANAIAEWDAQAKAFADYTVGKTAAEVLATETTVNDEGYQVPADETLYASVTMSIESMMQAIALAATYAR